MENAYCKSIQFVFLLSILNKIANSNLTSTSLEISKYTNKKHVELLDVDLSENEEDFIEAYEAPYFKKIADWFIIGKIKATNIRKKQILIKKIEFIMIRKITALNPPKLKSQR